MSGSGSEGTGRQALEQRQTVGGGRPSRDLAEGVLRWLRPSLPLDTAAPGGAAGLCTGHPKVEAGGDNAG